MDKILVTGGCGFIGSNLVENLVKEGHEVVVLDNLIRGDKGNLSHLTDSEDLRLIRGDVRSKDTVDEAIQGCDYVYHLAAVCLNRSIKYPRESFEVNMIGTNNVFQSAAEHDVRKVLFASSASVYGDQDPPMRETDAPRPKTPYGIAKLSGEYLLDFYARQEDLDYVAYRFFNVYGAGQDTDAYYTSVINVFVERLLQGDAPVIHGSGDQSMDFVNVDDIVSALNLGREKNVKNDVFNVGSGESTSIAELAELLVDIVGAEVEPQYESRDVIVSNRKADTEHAKEGLGFETGVTLREGLEEVVEHIVDGEDRI